MNTIQKREAERVSFVLERDGMLAAIKFCKQGISVYTSALKEPYSKKVEEEFIESVNYYRFFLLTNQASKND